MDDCQTRFVDVLYSHISSDNQWGMPCLAALARRGQDLLGNAAALTTPAARKRGL